MDCQPGDIMEYVDEAKKNKFPSRRPTPQAFSASCQSSKKR
ncbi:MAG: hypothetical protein LBE82_05370 [Chitinophagaceae bacterium]|nr:hypothetical protein [Chitinophagaceae bacterium]